MINKDLFRMKTNSFEKKSFVNRRQKQTLIRSAHTHLSAFPFYRPRASSFFVVFLLLTRARSSSFT